jgi:hypothetical protein
MLELAIGGHGAYWRFSFVGKLDGVTDQIE